MSRQFTILCFSFLLMGAGVNPAWAAELYSRSTDFGAVRLSHAELMQLIDKLRSLTATANKASGADSYSETLDLSGSSLTLSLDTGFSLYDLKRAEATSFSVHYRFENSKAPISVIDLDFGDHKRKLSVRGAAAVQVDAVIATLGQEIAQSTTIFGGTTFRVWTNSILFTLGILMTLAWSIPQTVVITNDKGHPLLHLDGPTKTLFLLVGILALVAVWFAPWETWVPGTALYATDASFIVRNSALISLIGTLATIVALLLAVLFRFRERLKSAATTESFIGSSESLPASNEALLNAPSRESHRA